MTDGHSNHPLCDDCRGLVVVFFQVFRSLQVAVDEARKAKKGA
jgi:hypothetical protein